MREAICHQEAIGRDAQRGVVMKAAPASTFVMRQPEFLLQFLIIALDAPAHLGRVHELAAGGVGGQVGQPVLGAYSAEDDR